MRDEWFAFFIGCIAGATIAVIGTTVYAKWHYEALIISKGAATYSEKKELEWKTQLEVESVE